MAASPSQRLTLGVQMSVSVSIQSMPRRCAVVLDLANRSVASIVSRTAQGRRRALRARAELQSWRPTTTRSASSALPSSVAKSSNPSQPLSISTRRSVMARTLAGSRSTRIRFGRQDDEVAIFESVADVIPGCHMGRTSVQIDDLATISRQPCRLLIGFVLRLNSLLKGQQVFAKSPQPGPGDGRGRYHCCRSGPANRMAGGEIRPWLGS